MASVPTSDSHSLSGGEKRLLEDPASQVLDKTAPQFPFTSSKEELDLERRAIARLDLTVLPVMTMFYLLSFLVSVFKCFLQVLMTHIGHRIVPILVRFCLPRLVNCLNLCHGIAGNARVAGLQNSLSLTDHQYQICVTILYVYGSILRSIKALITDVSVYRPYICTELPANLLLRRIGPNVLMPTVLTLWGIVVTFQGAWNPAA